MKKICAATTAGDVGQSLRFQNGDTMDPVFWGLENIAGIFVQDCFGYFSAADGLFHLHGTHDGLPMVWLETIDRARPGGMNPKIKTVFHSHQPSELLQ